MISSSAGKSVRASIKLAAELNCGIEISRLPLYKNEGMTVSETIDILLADLEGFKNRRTVHAMFSDVNIAGPDYELRAIAQKRCFQSFETARAIGADTVLFYTGYKGTKHYGSIYQFKKNFAAFWIDFVKEFENAGMSAVIENVFENSPFFCLELKDSIPSDNFRLALDTGHVNLYAPETKITDWIKQYGRNLYHMHIHNNYGINDDHSNLLNGSLDFQEIFACLEEEGLQPSMVLEMFTEEDILKSAAFIKEFYNK